MSDGWLRLLCALAAFCIPMGFAWWVTHRLVRRHRQGRTAVRPHAATPPAPRSARR